jgi:hypothetical protein
VPNFCAAAQIKFFQNGHATFTDQSPFRMTENAVKTYIWIAIAVYVLIAIVKKHLNLGMSLYTILAILSLTLFEKRPFYRDRQLSTIQN